MAIRSVSIGPSAIHESGHFYFAQTGHSHFAATAVEAFHHLSLGDDWAYLFLDGVWLKVRRATGPQRVLLLVA
jgi:transposase-like protein